MQDFKEYDKSQKHDTTKDHNNFLITEPKDMEICNSLPDKETYTLLNTQCLYCLI